MTHNDVDLSHISEADLAWMAGIIEGEGCFVLEKNRRVPCSKTIRIRVQMCDEDVIRRLLLVSKLGSVNGPCRSPSFKDHWKSRWVWAVCQKAQAAALLLRLLPWLGERRAAKALDCLAHIGAAVNYAKGASACLAGSELACS